ncbi:MAG: FAD-dependent oxidoreductase [Desulfatitalea sp.]|nr:FAD-dependent oxidoreductase [Desulfatitalea sp.]
MFDNLFSPLNLGQIELKNRIVYLAHRTNYARHGELTDQHIAYYKRRARGGCGLIIVGELSIHPNDRPWEKMIEAYPPGVVESYRRLTGAVHPYGAKLFANLIHHGFQSSGAITRQAIWGPSAVSDIVFGETAKAMEPEDIQEVIRAFAHAALLARQGGFDGIEIDMGPESLLRQFLSTLSNYRTDEYGGSLENRMRLCVEVINAVVHAVGTDFPLGINLCADEHFWGAITIDESREMAQRFEATGHIDFFNISVGTYYNLYLKMATMYTPPGQTVEYSRLMKQSVHAPVICGYQILSPQMAEGIIADHKADAAGFVRPLICDPDFPSKAAQSKTDTIRYCALDNEGCIGRVNQSKALACTQNSMVGFESSDGEEKVAPALHRKKTIVIGAGPAGLEAARIAKLRGHDVTLYDQEEKPGGQIRRMMGLPGRGGMARMIQNFHTALQVLNVPLKTGMEMTPEKVLDLNPDAVIIATGSRPATKPYPGQYGPAEVLNIFEVLEKRYPLGQKILLIDEHGGHYAAATAEMLVEDGRQVHMITSDLFIGIELANIGDLYYSRQRLLQKGVKFKTDIIVDAIEGKTVNCRDLYTNAPVCLDDYDTIVLAGPKQAQDRIYRQLKGQVKELYRAGDCVAPRNITMAVLEGRKAGERL